MSSSLTFKKVENEQASAVPVSIYMLVGRIDPETAPDFESTMKNFQKTEKNLIFDFSNLSYLNSFGIGILVDNQKNFIKNNGVIKICGLSPSIKKIFQITYLTRVFEIYEDIAQTLASFSQKTTTM